MLFLLESIFTSLVKLLETMMNGCLLMVRGVQCGVSVISYPLETDYFPSYIILELFF